MTEAERERKIFWSLFNTKLAEMGDPFTICYEMGGEIKHFACVNRNVPRVALGLTIDFLYRYKTIKCGIYIENDVKLFNYLYSKQAEIEKELGFFPMWIFSGEKNVNTRRILTKFPVKIGNTYDYAQVIEKMIPCIIKYKTVFEKYIYNIFEF